LFYGGFSHLLPTFINIHAITACFIPFYPPILISLTKPSSHCDQVKTLPIQN